MVDNQSHESKRTTLECMVCGFREIFTERQFKSTDGFSCMECGGPVKHSITKPNEVPNNRRMKGHVRISREASEVRRRVIERNISHCFNITPKQMETIIDLYDEVKNKEKDSIDFLSIDKPSMTKLMDTKEPTIKDIRNVTVNVDLSNVIKELKAIQRESKKATSALKELERIGSKVEVDIP
jgi:hypothetical protein